MDALVLIPRQYPVWSRDLSWAHEHEAFVLYLWGTCPVMPTCASAWVEFKDVLTKAERRRKKKAGEGNSPAGVSLLPLTSLGPVILLV